MTELQPIIIAALTGLVFGFLLSIPVGPVNLTIMNEGARRGFARGVVIGLGASSMEVIYCAIAFTGFASFFDGELVKALMEVISFVFMLGLGVRFISTRTVPKANRFETRIERGLHPHSAFMTGFVRVMANPGVLLFWILLAGNFLSRDWVTPTWQGKAACVGGVMVGTSAWFVGLSYAVSRGHRKFSDQTLVKMQKGSGVVLLAYGTFNGVRIAWELAKHYKR
jgi:threonine/homoserine/homoserine lactone efflux protein